MIFLKVFLKYFLSYFKNDWKLSDYPIETRKHKIQPGTNPNPERFKQILFSVIISNWYQMSGNGDSKEEAYIDLKNKFLTYKKEHKDLPRPGQKVPIEFASMEMVAKYQKEIDSFLTAILDIDPNATLITDESSLGDFHYENSDEKFYKKIMQIYKVDVSDIKDGKIIKIIERIKNKQNNNE